MVLTPPYECIRCGYTTIQKARMRHHLYSKKNICPCLKNDIELTNEIKDKILINRKYVIPKKIVNKPEIINNEKEYHYIYMIRPRENVRHNENIYKIGKTKVKNPDINISRLISYGKGTEIIHISLCNNCDIVEREILEELNKKFDKHTGNEYFIGDRCKILNIILEIVMKDNQNSMI